MKRLKPFRTILFGLSFAIGSQAMAAECQLRNLGFVGITAGGWLIVNAELWNAVSGQNVGYAANTALCNMNPGVGAISYSVCQSWYSIATTAMLANKKIYINPPACTPGNPARLDTDVFGLNH